MAADDRFSSRAILTTAQFRWETAQSHGGFSAYRMALGLNPVDLTVRQDGDSDLQFARDTSISGHFVQRRQPRTTAQEAFS